MSEKNEKKKKKQLLKKFSSEPEELNELVCIHVLTPLL